MYGGCLLCPLYPLLVLLYCNQVWYHCGKGNTAKIEKVNERALGYIFIDKSASYQDLLERIRLPSMETRKMARHATDYSANSNGSLFDAKMKQTKPNKGEGQKHGWCNAVAKADREVDEESNI